MPNIILLFWVIYIRYLHVYFQVIYWVADCTCKTISGHIEPYSRKWSHLWLMSWECTEVISSLFVSLLAAHAILVWHAIWLFYYDTFDYKHVTCLGGYLYGCNISCAFINSARGFSRIPYLCVGFWVSNMFRCQDQPHTLCGNTLLGHMCAKSPIIINEWDTSCIESSGCFGYPTHSPIIIDWFKLSPIMTDWFRLYPIIDHQTLGKLTLISNSIWKIWIGYHMLWRGRTRGMVC